MSIPIFRTSYFKDPLHDHAWFAKWVAALEALNDRSYERIEVQTALGKTQVWGLQTQNTSLEALVVFPGARTSALFWDIDRGLDSLEGKFRVYLVETNGLPNPSDGNTPDIRTPHYGAWAAELLDGLQLEKAYVAGASFGGLVCMKLCLAAPQRVKAAFLLNPGCLQPFSLSIKNLYYNLLPIVFPYRKSVQAFLDRAIFCKPHHQVSRAGEELIVKYELFALNRFVDRTQKPYHMNGELGQVRVDTYLLVGGRDLLFPAGISINQAVNSIPTLKDVMLFEQVGHGIETYGKAIGAIGRIIRRRIPITI